MTGGGTAGHIYPAIALANKLKSDGHELLFIGTKEGLESELVSKAGFDFLAVEAKGFDRARPWTLVSSGLAMLHSSTKAKKILRDFKAEVVIAFGAYVSIPVSLAARRLGLPLVLHEQNSVPGLANKMLAPQAELIMLSYRSAQSYFKRVDASKFSLTGNPVRAEVLSVNRDDSRLALGLKDEDKLLVVFGGSRGARKLNLEFIKRAKNILDSSELKVVHVCGDKLFNESVEALKKREIDFEQSAEFDFSQGSRYFLKSYLNNLYEILSAADFVICRSGATTLAEVSALGLPALLVPYPFATDDHQTKNAAHFVEAGAALLIADADLENDAFDRAIAELVGSESLRTSLSEQILKLSHKDAASKMVDSIYSMRSVAAKNSTDNSHAKPKAGA